MKILKDLSFLLSSQGLLSLLNIIIQIILARFFTSSDYGTFTTIMTTITLLATINGFGINGYWLRMFSVYGKNAFESVKYVKGILLISSLFTILIWISLFFFLNLTVPFFIYLLYVIPLLCYGLLPTVTAINQISDSIIELSLWRVLNRAILFSSAISLLIMNYNSLNDFSILFIIFSAVSLFFIVKKINSFGVNNTKINERYKDISKENNGHINYRTVIINSTPYMLLGFFYLFYYQSDLLLLNIFRGANDVAIYNVAFLLISVIYMILALVFNVYLLPSFHVLRNRDTLKFMKYIRKITFYCVIIGVLFTIAVFISSEIVISLLFGNDYLNAIIYLKVLSFAIPFRFVATSLSSLLLDEKTVWHKVSIQGTAALLNLFLNLITIPIWGIIGAVVTTLFTEIFVSILYYIYVRRKNN